MLLKVLMPVALLGLTGCLTTPTSGDGLCDALRPYEARARAAMLEHAAEVPDEVGEAVTDLLIGYRAGC